jgi:hypothetical protein
LAYKKVDDDRTLGMNLEISLAFSRMVLIDPYVLNVNKINEVPFIYRMTD